MALNSGNECLLEHAHDGSDPWPWAYRAQMRIRLDGEGCFIGLVLVNCADEPMPTGLGLHPYFRRDAETTVWFESDGVLNVDAELIPTGTKTSAGEFGLWSHGAKPPARLVDHCHTGWSGKVQLTDSIGSIAMSAIGAPHLHVYMPPGQNFLCCEPVSHLPNAHNSAPETLTMLAPGNAASLSLLIHIR